MAERGVQRHNLGREELDIQRLAEPQRLGVASCHVGLEQMPVRDVPRRLARRPDNRAALSGAIMLLQMAQQC